jgi:hypothetical protein
METFSFQFNPLHHRLLDTIFYSSRTLARWISDAQRVNRNGIDHLLFFYVSYLSCTSSKTMMNLFAKINEISQLQSATIEWIRREIVRARLRVMVKRILRKYGYPPDKQEKATMTVLRQAELIARDWAG